jgi:integrase
MASLSKDKGGLWRLQFIKDETRHAVRLGKMSQRSAEDVRNHVERILANADAGIAPDPSDVAWATTISERLASSLAAKGVIPERPKHTSQRLGKFIDHYLDGRTMKPNTKRNYKQTKRYLVEHFGDDRRLTSVTPADADAWRENLRRQELASATISRQVKAARMIFKAAMRGKIIRENPFAELKAGSQANSSREFFVTREVIAKVLDACPDSQWRLIVALSRFGGLRCPSEHLALRWGDIDWAQNRIIVRSTKTEHHSDGGMRIVPLFPELRPFLDEADELAPPGSEFVVTKIRDPEVNLRTQFQRIIARAGVKPWERLFHNLRASRQTDLANDFPLHVVCEWLGNSPAVASSHYLQVTDSHYDKATQGGAESGARVAQNAAQHHSAGRTQETQKAPKSSRLLPNSAESCPVILNCHVLPTGVEHPSITPVLAEVSPETGAESGALDARLRDVIDAWPLLPAAARDAIAAIARQAKRQGE